MPPPGPAEEDPGAEVLEVQAASAFKRFCPALAVYLPKFVCIHNPRIGLLYWLLFLLCVITTVYYVVSNDKYNILVEPDMKVTMCGTPCVPAAEDLDRTTSAAMSQPYCQGPAGPYAANGVTYSNITCVGRCGQRSAASCIFPQELLQAHGEEVFVPTFYREAVFGSGGTRTGDFFVAGAEKASVVFNHEFYVIPYKNSLSFARKPAPLRGHSAAFASQGWDKGLLTVLFHHDGSERRRWLPTNPINVSLEELLQSAYYDGVESGGPLSLDTLYSNAEYGIAPDGSTSGLPLRLTGAVVTVDLYTTDRGVCPFYDTFRKSVKQFKVTWPGPSACLMVHAERLWTSVADSSPLGFSGATRQRQAFGVRVRFRKTGVFRFFDEQAFINNLTVFFVWIQIPLIITYWFCVTALGHLSYVYSRVIHTELSLGEACKGLAARLVSHSAAFMDLKDNASGMSKRRIRERFRHYFENNEHIDEDELDRFVDFVYKGLKSFGSEGQPESDLVTLQEFCAACLSNEPLRLETLVRLFDKDRQMGCIEAVFLDDIIRQLHSSGREEGEEEEEEEAPAPRAEARRTARDEDAPHSRLLQAYTDVQAMIDSLSKISNKARSAARELDAGPEVMALFGHEDAQPHAGLLSSMAPPKLDQRESFISIADEEEPGRRRTEILQR